jgi:hypothetical protein
MRRAVLALLLAPPLVLLALIGWSTLSHHPRPVRTGDALLDSYLQAVAEAGDGSALYGATGTGTRSPVQWDAWEQRYGADPRFWMLCYNVRLVSFRPNAQYLRTAQARGSADWVVLLNLLRHEYTAWCDAASAKLALQEPGSQAGVDELAANNRRRWAEVVRRHGPELAQLQAGLARSGAKQAQVHYCLARIKTQSGDLAGALRELEAGNAAPFNDAGLGPPYDELYEAARRGQALAGDSALAGTLDVGHFPGMLTDFLQIKREVELLSAWAADRRDLAALTALHRYCCRWGSSAGADALQATLAAGMDEAVLDAVARITPPAATARRQALSQAQSLAQQIGSASRSITSSQLHSLPGVPQGIDWVYELTPATSNCSGYINLELMRNQGQGLIAQQAALAGPIGEQLAALAALDITQ